MRGQPPATCRDIARGLEEGTAVEEGWWQRLGGRGSSWGLHPAPRRTRSSCPGTYVAKYHLGQLGGLVLAESEPFEARLRPPRAHECEAADRELRFLLVGTMADLAKERAVLRSSVLPAVQAALESRLLSVAVLALSEGVDEEDAQPRQMHQQHEQRAAPTPQAPGKLIAGRGAVLNLAALLAEMDCFFPRLLFLFGEQYGYVPDAHPASLLAARPWLAQSVERATGRQLPGVRASVIELAVLHAALARPRDAAIGAAFFFRDPAEPVLPAAGRTPRLSAAAAAARSGNLWSRSVYYREAQDDLRATVLRCEPLAGTAVHYNDPSGFASAVRAHLEAAVAQTFPGAPRLAPAARARAFTDAVLARLAAGPDSLPLVLDGPASEDAIELFESPVPVLLTGPPRSGKSVRLATAIAAYMAMAVDDTTVTTATADKAGGGYPLFSCIDHDLDLLGGHGLRQFQPSLYVHFRAGAQRVMLVQYLGLESTAADTWAVLRDAMEATCHALRLGIERPWDEQGLMEAVPAWLDAVLAKAVFVWVLDGLDCLVSPSSVDVYAPALQQDIIRSPAVAQAADDTVTSATRASGIKEHDSDRFTLARAREQSKLRHWLLPMLDEASQLYAPRRFPGLRLVVARSTRPESDLLRAGDTAFSRLAVQRRSLRVVTVDVWTQRDKARFVADCTAAGIGGAGTAMVSEPPGLMQLLFSEIVSQKGTVDKKKTGPYDLPGYAALQVLEAMSIEEAEVMSVPVAREHFNALKSCTTVHDLCLACLRRRMQSEFSERALTFLYLARHGLREMELLHLIASMGSLTDEVFLQTLRSIGILIMKLAGFLILKPEFKEAMLKHSEHRGINSVAMENMAKFFEALNCEQRQMQELPYLYLRLGKYDQLLSYVCRPSAFRWIAKARILQLILATGIPQNTVTLLLKEQFEAAFSVRKGTNCKYELDKIEKGNHFSGFESEKSAECSFGKFCTENSESRSIRNSRIQGVYTFCTIGLNIVDVIQSLEISNLEVAEMMIEGFLKMLHMCNSLVMVSERQSKYPRLSFECLMSYSEVFEHALNSVQHVEISPNRRLDDLREQRIRVLQELMLAKVKLLLKISEGVAEQLLVMPDEGPDPFYVAHDGINSRSRSHYHSFELYQKLRAILIRCSAPRSKYFI